jgi:hypothetical protein
MNPVLLLAISLLGSQADESVPMPVQYDQPYAIETRIHRTRRTGDADPLTQDTHWRIEVQPTDEGFKTRWRDLDTRDRTDLLVDANERLQPLRVNNLDTVWSERGSATIRFTTNNSDITQALSQTVPDVARQTLLLRDATLIATGQGLDLAVGNPLVQRLPGQRIGTAPSISILSTLALVSVDQATGKAVVTWTTELDPKEVAAGLPGMVRALLGLSEEESAKLENFDEILDQAVMTNRRACRYDIDLSSGLAEHATCDGFTNFTIGDHVEKTEDRMEATQRRIP